MNNKKTTLILILLISLIVSCTSDKNKNHKAWNLVMKDGLLYNDSLAQKPFTGHYKGSVMGRRIEYEVVDGKRTGLFVLYNENGNVETFGYQKENKNHGEWKYYYPDGSLESVGLFVDDKPDSIWTWFYINGNLMQEGSFSGGMRDGDWKFFNESGNLYSIMRYKDNLIVDSIRYVLPGTNSEVYTDSAFKYSE
jgi:antitoxin component YwqK of YwqJK toxin-antitoxin module